MIEISTILAAVVRLIFSFDPELYAIISLSLVVSVAAVSVAAVVGVPLGVVLGLRTFFGRTVVINTLNTLMGMPPVVIGLVVFLLLSRQGPFGRAELLFSPAAMAIAQTLLTVPIVAGLTYATVVSQNTLLRDLAYSLGASRWQTVWLVIFEARHGIITALVTGFGRAISEVGAVLLVGGNIKHSTRTMTTAIAMQTSMGDYELALALGLILILIAAVINLIFLWVQRSSV